MARGRNRVTDLAVAGGCACALLGGMAAIDDGVRGYVTTANLAATTVEVQGMSQFALRTLVSYGHAHGSLMMFVVAGAVLFLFMFRL